MGALVCMPLTELRARDGDDKAIMKRSRDVSAQSSKMPAREAFLERSKEIQPLRVKSSDMIGDINTDGIIKFGKDADVEHTLERVWILENCLKDFL